MDDSSGFALAYPQGDLNDECVCAAVIGAAEGIGPIPLPVGKLDWGKDVGPPT